MDDGQIVSTPGVLSGVPRLAGTRIQVEMIEALIADGCDDEGVQLWYPSVTDAHLAAVRSRIAQMAGAEVAPSQVSDVPPTGFEPVDGATIDAGQTA